MEEASVARKESLVVKLLRKCIGFLTLRDRLSTLWKLEAGFDMMFARNGYFMVKFDSMMDRAKAIDGGP